MFNFTSKLKSIMLAASAMFAVTASAVELRLSDAPANGQWAENTNWYYLRDNTNRGYLSSSRVNASGGLLLPENSTLDTSDAGFWCFVGNDTDGYLIYNKASGTEKVFSFVGNSRAIPGKMVDKSSLTDESLARVLFVDNGDAVTHTISTTFRIKLAAQKNPDDFSSSTGLVNIYFNRGSGALLAHETTTNKYYFTLQTVLGLEENIEPTNAILDIYAAIFGETAKEPFDTRIANAANGQELNEIREEIDSRIDRRVFYLVSNGRKEANKPYYVELDKERNVFVGTDIRSDRAKWQLVNTGNGYALRNIATDTYISGAGGNMTGKPCTPNWYRKGQFKFDFYRHPDGGLLFKFTGNNYTSYIGNGDNDFYTCNYPKGTNNNVINNTPFDLSCFAGNKNYSFTLEPCALTADEIVADATTGNYVVIRSQLGKRHEDIFAVDEAGSRYPGSLVTAYAADRQSARQRAGYVNGAHLEIYSCGAAWKFVPVEGQTNQYKIYSLIGEQTNGNTKGLKVGSVVEGKTYIDIAENPDVFTLDPITFEGVYTPHTFALKYGEQYVHVSNENRHGDFFLYLSDTAPANTPDDPATFFIEELGSEGDATTLVDAYIDYARNLRMFETIKGVLTDEEQQMAIAQKGKYKDNLSLINSIATANEFMELGDKTASTIAFELLNGKIVRFKNRFIDRRHPDVFSFLNAAPDGTIANLTTNYDADPAAAAWEVLLPHGENGTECARMRRITLRNVKTGTYLMHDLSLGVLTEEELANEQTTPEFRVRRRNPANTNQYFMALAKSDDRNNCLAMFDNGSDHEQESETTLDFSANNSMRAHWLMLGATHTAPVTVAMTKVDAGHQITISSEGATLAVTPGLTVKATITEIQPEAAAFALTDGSAELTFTEGQNGTLVATVDGLTPAAGEADKQYSVNIPANAIHADGNLVPALSNTFTVKSNGETSGIGCIEVEGSAKADVIYDLQGRRVSRAVKGIYIINGVKTIVK